MRNSEEEYINRINALQAEIDEDNELLEKAKEKIDELNLKLSLSESSFSKKKISEKQKKVYEDKINELELCLGAYSVDVLETKEDEIETFLKRIIAIKNELNTIKDNKRITSYKILEFEDNLANISKDLAIRFIELNQAIRSMSGKSDLESIDKEYLHNINLSLGIIKEVLSMKESEYIKVKKENEKLKDDILNGNKTEIDKIVKAKDFEIQSLKDKIARLEYENNSKGE